jgi:hypothetical protein
MLWWACEERKGGGGRVLWWVGCEASWVDAENFLRQQVGQQGMFGPRLDRAGEKIDKLYLN